MSSFVIAFFGINWWRHFSSFFQPFLPALCLCGRRLAVCGGNGRGRAGAAEGILGSLLRSFLRMGGCQKEKVKPERERERERGGNVSKCRKEEETGLRRQYVNCLCRCPNNQEPLAFSPENTRRAFRTLGHKSGGETRGRQCIETRVTEARASLRL